VAIWEAAWQNSCQIPSVAVYDRYPEKIALHQDFPQIKICRDPQEAISSAELILLFLNPMIYIRPLLN